MTCVDVDGNFISSTEEDSVTVWGVRKVLTSQPGILVEGLFPGDEGLSESFLLVSSQTPGHPKAQHS